MLLYFCGLCAYKIQIMLIIWLASILSKLGTYKHKLHCTQQQRNDNNGMYLIVVFYINYSKIYLLIPQFLEFPDFSSSRMGVLFIPCNEDKIRIYK
jgi:hypothetical protein